MFANLKLSMFNSVGTRVAVNLFKKGGKIEFEILYPDLGVQESERSIMDKSSYDKLMRALKKKGTLELLHRFRIRHEPHEDDTWSLDLDFGHNDVIRASGPDFNTSEMRPVLQDLVDILDELFPQLRLVSSARIEKLVLGFIFNEFSDRIIDMIPESEGLDHLETVELDRDGNTLVYSKRYPAGCYNSMYVCRCEQQVRSILDQTSELMTDPVLFEDISPKPGEPFLTISITYHDGSLVRVIRSLSSEGLRDRIYFELLDVIYDTLLHLLFKQGIFDKRFLGSENEISRKPFTVSYNEEDAVAQ